MNSHMSDPLFRSSQKGASFFLQRHRCASPQGSRLDWRLRQVADARETPWPVRLRRARAFQIAERCWYGAGLYVA